MAKGYYDLPDKTAESFYEENGTRWFRTGRNLFGRLRMRHQRHEESPISPKHLTWGLELAIIAPRRCKGIKNIALN